MITGYQEEDDGYEEQSLMLTTEQKEFIESQFEKTLEEYDEDDIGDLEDVSTCLPLVSCYSQ